MSDAARDVALERVLALAREAIGAQPIAIEPVTEGMATRRFVRLHFPGDARAASVIARIEAPEDPARLPPGVPPEPRLEPLRAFLEASGLPVPRAWAHDDEAGVDLLEDVGTRALRDVVATATPDERAALYEAACDLVPRLQALRDPGDLPAFRRRLGAPFFAYKADFFVRFALPQALRREARATEAAVVREAFALICDDALAAPARLAHRDFQSANLIVRDAAPACAGTATATGAPRAAPAARIVMIDLQGALLAPPEYDLVCLLHDSYVELPEAERARLAGRARPRLPDAPDADTFSRRFDRLVLARKGKDLALFHFHAARGDRRWLRFVPGTLRSLKGAAARRAGEDPRLARLAELVMPWPEETPCEA